MKDEVLYLRHIRDAINKIDGYIAQIGYQEFASNDMAIDAVVRELEIIGEACNNLSPDFRRTNDEIPFRDIIDMRNVLIHQYAGVNTKVVWDTCKNDLPLLRDFVEKLLNE
ncbi:MAG: DUF86 domain-containing protein [Sedimentisphaerales bacterium]|nr:DUF86 domain-containing protein [Sedimentisphaerales bacterium]